MIKTKMVDINVKNDYQGYFSTSIEQKGPNLLLIQEIFGVNNHIKSVADTYAKQGYNVLAPDLFYKLKPGFTCGYSQDDMSEAFKLYSQFDIDSGVADLQEAVNYLKNLPTSNGKIAVLGFCLGGTMSYRLACQSNDIDAAVSYYGGGIENYLDLGKNIKCPIIFHYGSLDKHIPLSSVNKVENLIKDKNACKVYIYNADHGFNCDERGSYNKISAQVAFERSLTFLQQIIGPDYDLNSIWEDHTQYEFTNFDVEATLATMTPDAIVNHVPTLTGGLGLDELKNFYTKHFIKHMPSDTKINVLNRTITSHKIIDEMIFSFTHDSVIDFMLPNVKPTGKYVEIAMVAVVTFEGDKIAIENVYWDQASVLLQLGLIEASKLPVAGSISAQKRIDKNFKS